MPNYLVLIIAFGILFAANEWMAREGVKKIKARLDAADAARQDEMRQRWLAPDVANDV